jgi:hypothetical protein
MGRKRIALRGIAVAALALVVVTLLLALRDEPGSLSLGPYDESLVQKLVSEEGLTPTGAIFLALTKFEVQALAKNEYRIRASFPTKNTADFTITLLADQKQRKIPVAPASGGNSLPIYLAASDFDEQAGGLQFRLEFLIAADAFPEGSLDSFRSSTGSSKIESFLDSVFPRAYAAAARAPDDVDSDPVVRTIVKGFVTRFRNELLKAFEQAAAKDVPLPKSGVVKPLTTVESSTKSVISSWDAREEHLSWMEQLERAQRCAENPTNPLTKKMYQEVAGSKEKTLQLIQEARLEVQMNTAVRFLGIMNKLALRLVSPHPIIGIVADAMVAWSDGTLKGVNSERVLAIQRMVTECKEEEEKEPQESKQLPEPQVEPRVGEEDWLPLPKVPGWHGTVTYNFRMDGPRHFHETQLDINLSGNGGNWSGRVQGKSWNECIVTLAHGTESGRVVLDKSLPGPGELSWSIDFLDSQGSYTFGGVTGPFIVRTWREWAPSRDPDCKGTLPPPEETSLPFAVVSPAEGEPLGRIDPANSNVLSGSKTWRYESSSGRATFTLKWHLTRQE